ncbi:venom peptide MmKTx1 isoform X2 [Rhipicephalus sanguineus]|uniref:venom peptide MmKTx1 isoform X1 n=1 Tax=Rhipicephalus sanguineus TaxID=34632 RepID=UPI0018956F53|nr:venom peptide MmKTx1 isoform X1 [Rhipicephalus sanguineus]XP_037522018.1 venom peptide MmKTx1 isoform X2 [Rhipicephalus sanguineus]
MKSIAALVLCAACCYGYVAVAPATMDGDDCLYEQLKIKNNETFHSENPCESFHCDARHKVVYVEGCIAVGLPHAGCHVTHGAGAFPACCSKIVCHPDQQSAQDSAQANSAAKHT